MSYRKSTPKLRLQLICKALNQKGAVCSPVFALLFFLKNHLADLPIHEYPLSIYRANGLFARQGNNTLYLLDEYWSEVHIDNG